jgi:hypothetical protein
MRQGCAKRRLEPQGSGIALVSGGMRSRLLLLALLAILAVLPASAAAAPVPTGADWSEATIQSSDGVKLHADILRPEGASRPTRRPR